MLKRLIEVALPLKEVSEQSAREKSIRHGHISTLHIWWARRPLAACRAVVFASLIPDPDDPDCPDEFRKLVMDELGSTEFRPKRNGQTLEDTPRNRCLEFIKELVKWENSNNPHYIEPARKLIKAAHKILHPDSDGEVPKVLDPFAGGGAIPLEALRLGCEAHAIELNPVAHLIELCTLVYPQKFGQPNSRPTPDYIKTLEAAHQNKIGNDLFNNSKNSSSKITKIDGISLNRLPLITEKEYQKNPLAADVKFWGHWVLEKARDEIGEFYPPDPDGSIPIAYLWARTVKCPNPACSATIPLVRQLWLCKKKTRKVAMKMTPNPKTKQCDFEIIEGNEIDFDPDIGTMQRGQAECPFCYTVVVGDALREESKAGRMNQHMTAMVRISSKQSGKQYRTTTKADLLIFKKAIQRLEQNKQKYGANIIPNEPMTPDRPSPNSRGLSGVVRYGIDSFGALFNARQALALSTLVRLTQKAMSKIEILHVPDYAKAVGSYLALLCNRISDYCNSLSRWDNTQQRNVSIYGRQALPMVWDYAEINPLEPSVGALVPMLNAQLRLFSGAVAGILNPARVVRGSATSTPLKSCTINAVITDPPYYDAVPYADLSDFFYVWLKRTLGNLYADEFRTPLTPKGQELIAYYGSGERRINKTPEWYEDGMREAFTEIHRTLENQGISCVMFAHKTTTAWEAVIGGLLNSGLLVTSSWPLHTEQTNRMVARNAAALASSVTLICRKRSIEARDGYWEDVKLELEPVVNERLDYFWDEGIGGADFFISAIGPALSVFGKYKKVVRLSGEEVTVTEFLDEVRQIVVDYVLDKIIEGGRTGSIDAETQFYLMWRWSYGDTKVPADEAFKVAQALGLPTKQMWDTTGVLEKSGESVQALPVAKRMHIRSLGDPSADGSPANIIDVLHRCCAFRDDDDQTGLVEFLGRSGRSRDESLWATAQAISEILPQGDKEKQLLQGLLNQRDRVESQLRLDFRE